MVIDGKTAYTGGINLADEYINEKVRFATGGHRHHGEGRRGGVIHLSDSGSSDDHCAGLRRKAVVGTVNLDYRSLYQHFECGLILYRNSQVAPLL